MQEWCGVGELPVSPEESANLDAIITSVPRPTAQHHDAPTCDGWWWVSVHGGEWQMKCVVGKTVWQNSQGKSWRMSYSGWNARWVGPLLPPDTTEHAYEPHANGCPANWYDPCNCGAFDRNMAREGDES